MCLEAMPGISLYSYLYLKLAKTLSFSLSLMFSLQQNQRTRGQKRFCPDWQGKGWGGYREKWSKQCIYMYVNIKVIK
jgi:hypothetical protein